jgi:hypothetical protein
MMVLILQIAHDPSKMTGISFFHSLSLLCLHLFLPFYPTPFPSLLFVHPIIYFSTLKMEVKHVLQNFSEILLNYTALKPRRLHFSTYRMFLQMFSFNSSSTWGSILYTLSLKLPLSKCHMKYDWRNMLF